MLQLLLSTDANQTFRTNLNGQSVTIIMRYQTVSESWFFSLYNTVDLEPLVINRRIEPGVLVFGHILKDFSGDFIAVSSSTIANIGRNDFNTIYGLYYVTDEEVDQIENILNG